MGLRQPDRYIHRHFGWSLSSFSTGRQAAARGGWGGIDGRGPSEGRGGGSFRAGLGLLLLLLWGLLDEPGHDLVDVGGAQGGAGDHHPRVVTDVVQVQL